MISPRTLATLDLSAASGLARDDDTAYVVADDEHLLDAYRVDTGARLARWTLELGGELPEHAEQRKRRKPDLEALCWLPGHRLLALGSGSTSARERAVLVELHGREEPGHRLIDLAPLYASLRTRFPELNIEGAAAAGGWLRLLQRGNGKRCENAVIDLDLAAALQSLERGEPLTGALLVAVRPVELGTLGGVRLGFTDASPVDPGDPEILFSAAAEDTDDPYLDGACAGSALGRLGRDGSLEWLEPIAGPWKVEGIALKEGGEEVLMVADPDDRAHAAPLLAAAIPDLRGRG